MDATVFQIDAFTDRLFSGNPAAVIQLDDFCEDKTLQALAAENNLSETAFLVPSGKDYRLRWFTPTAEVDLCGHATLACGAVVMEKLEPGRTEVIFHTASGLLGVRKQGHSYILDLPLRKPIPIAVPLGLVAALNAQPREVLFDTYNYMVVLEDALTVKNLTPDLEAIKKLAVDGVIVTSTGEEDYDFVSRYFMPAKGIAEDPVTGSAHCSLAPYWAHRLGKIQLRAYQLSYRGGEIICRICDDRVELEGQCVFYMEGKIHF